MSVYQPIYSQFSKIFITLFNSSDLKLGLNLNLLEKFYSIATLRDTAST